MVEKNKEVQLTNVYIERCDKETEQLISEENTAFLEQPLTFLKKHKNEFIYLELEWLDSFGVDALSLELDDVFGTYDVMLGLKLQKKYDSSIREQLHRLLSGEEPKFDLMFNREDGLWDLNFSLNYVEGFDEELSIGQACEILNQFLLKLVDRVKNKGE